MAGAAGALEVVAGGEAFTLLPEKAVWWPARRSLLVADAHFGKAVSFRRWGVPVPRGTTSESLDRLAALVERHAADEIVFLGDFLHSRRSHAPSTLGALMRWRARHPRLRLTLVRGNHDDRAGDPPAALDAEVVDEPLRRGTIALCHHPRAETGAYALAGHLHPCCAVGGRAHDRVRLPCFHFGREVAVLPAFGSFTGMHPVARGEGARVFVVAGDAVLALPG